MKSQNIFANNLYMLNLAWKICPGRVVSSFIGSAVGHFEWMFSTVIFLEYIIGAVERGIGFPGMVRLILLVALVYVVCESYEAWHERKYKPLMEQRSYKRLYEALFNKAANVELACYEDPHFYHTYTLAAKEAGERLSSVVDSVSGMLFKLIFLFYVVYRMFSIDSFMILFVIFPMVGNFVFLRLSNKREYQRDLENNVNDRKRNYVNRVFYLVNYAKEIRLSKIENILKKQYKEAYEGTNKIIKKHSLPLMFLTFLYDTFTFSVVFQGILLYGAYRVIVSETIAISEFAILIGMMSTVTWMLIHFTEDVMAFHKNGYYIGNFRNFLEYKPAIAEDQPGAALQHFEKSLELRGVCFTYSGAKEETLKDINLTIKKGEKIAVVGHNGAGKSTFIKLLMRLYDPTSGQIVLDGQDIKLFDLQDYRRLFSAAFQDQRMFSMSVAENVSDDRIKAVQALRQSGIWEKINRLPEKEDSILTREFDDNGVVLSGGQTQKISIARAFAKDFEIGIFDEPSSALDPIAENKLFESMMEVFEGKTVIFISHRLSSARLADRIYMFGGGRVLEEGTHDELMARRGDYAAMFTMQAEKYVENEFSLLEEGINPCEAGSTLAEGHPASMQSIREGAV